jgi:hypothetical protein
MDASSLFTAIELRSSRLPAKGTLRWVNRHLYRNGVIYAMVCDRLEMWDGDHWVGRPDLIIVV